MSKARYGDMEMHFFTELVKNIDDLERPFTKPEFVKLSRAKNSYLRVFKNLITYRFIHKMDHTCFEDGEKRYRINPHLVRFIRWINTTTSTALDGTVDEMVQKEVDQLLK